MNFITSIARLMLAILAAKNSIKTIEGADSIIDIVNYINTERKIKINILLNLAENEKSGENLEEIRKISQTPKLFISNASHPLDTVRPVFERFNKNCLTIVWLSESHVNVSLDFLDRLLWRIHFKDILLIYQRGAKKHGMESNNNDELYSIFQKCWSKGFISVLLWSDYQLYTYHPYPKIKLVALNSVTMFMDKSHLNNFHQYTCRMPFFDYPNLCFNYTNRQGELIRTGYLYKWVQFYLEYYNASIDHYFLNMWRQDYKHIDAIKYLNKVGYCLMPVFIGRDPEYFEISKVPYLTRVVLLVPNAKEIRTTLYLMLPYNGFIWCLIIVSGVLFYFLMFCIQRNTNMATDFSKLALQAFSVIIFLASGFSDKKSLKIFYFHLLFLFTGIFLTNYYTSFLSSLFAAKVYEEELKCINDIARTNLKILEHSYDEEFILNMSLPKALNGRFVWTGNAELAKYRQILNTSHILTTHDEVADFLLFQQYYLKHPIAKVLDQEMFTRAQYITLPHRSPLIDHFNTYMSRMLENGLLMKSIADTKLDGIWSGYIKFMRDPIGNESLTLDHFYYAFLIWMFGLLCSLVAFLLELQLFKRNRYFCF